MKFQCEGFCFLLLIVIFIITGILFFNNKNSSNQTFAESNTSNVMVNTSNINNNEIKDFDLNEMLDNYANQLSSSQDSSISSNSGTSNNQPKEIVRGYLFEYKSGINDITLIRKYLANYSYLALNQIEESYQLLDTDFKSKFDSLNQYKSFLQKNAEFIYNLSKAHYENLSVTRDINEHMYIYTFTDSKGREYTIKEKAIMKYTLNIEEVKN